MSRFWRPFEDRAMSVLRREHVDIWIRLRQVLQLVEAPCFGSVSSWTIWSPPFTEEYRCCHQVWEMGKDYPEVDPELPDRDEVFRSLLPAEPTIHVAEFSVVDVEAMLAKARFLVVPAFASLDDPGNDGVEEEITFGNQLQGATFRWCNNGAAPWKPLRVLFEEFKSALLNAQKPASS